MEKKCTVCLEVVTDGAYCNACEKELHYQCAGITEVGYRKLGERKLVWRCHGCKQSGQQILQADAVPAVPNSLVSTDQPSTSVLLAEIRALSAKLAPLESLTQDVKALREEFVGLQASFKVASVTINDFATKVKKIEDRLMQVENAKRDQVNLIQSRLDRIEEDIRDKEQWSRINNVEIKGVKQTKNENLFDIVNSIGVKINYPIQKNTINFVTRVQSRNTEQTKPIIVSFNNRYIKQDFVAASRTALKESPLKTSALGLGGNDRIYINDHLTVHYKTLLSKVKRLKIEMGFQYLWVKNCKIFMRRDDTSPIIFIKSEEDLSKVQKLKNAGQQ